MSTDYFSTQAIGLTEKQFNELMSIPHTFFYLRVRKDSSLDPKAANLHNVKSKHNHLSNTSRHGESGSDETKTSPALEGKHSGQILGSAILSMRYNGPEQNKSTQSLFNSQSVSNLVNSRGNVTDESVVIKKLAWSGKIPVRPAPAKKFLLTSTSSLGATNSMVSFKSQLKPLDLYNKPPVPPAEVIPPNISDMEEIPESTMKDMKDSFERSAGVGGSVYDLEVASQDTIDLNFYFTLSKEGVTQYSHKSSQFTSLAQWHREYLLFHRISAIR